MTTTPQSPNGTRVPPPPCSTENPAEPNRADCPTDKANNNPFAPDDQVVERQQGPFPAGAYHVPPERYAPKADFLPQEFPPSGELDTTPLPERCQFMFSDGRQCSMARSDIHPSLCRFHSEREDQLFGHPTLGGHVVGRAFDLPELYSASRDLTTAAGVNRALGQVFRLLAQRPISRQEAATFGHLAQLLLRSISAARSSRESHGDQELSRVNEVADLIQPESSSLGASRSEAPLLRPGRLRGESLSDRRTSEESFPGSTPSRFDGQSAAQDEASSPSGRETKQPSIALVEREKAVPITALFAHEEVLPTASTATSAPRPEHAAVHNSVEIEPSTVAVGNPPRINTYEIAGLKPIQNDSLR